MKRSSRLWISFLRLVQVTDLVAHTAERALRGPGKRRLALTTARSMLAEEGLHPPAWVVETALRLARRRLRGETPR